MAKLLLFLALALFLASPIASAHGDHDFYSDSHYFPYKETRSSSESLKKEYTSPDGRERFTVSERVRTKSTFPGKTESTRTTTVKRTSVNYPAYAYHDYGYDYTDWRYQKDYRYSDYGKNEYGKAYYYDPTYHYNGHYNWRY